jgi:SAM-dependent methyltransferase
MRLDEKILISIARPVDAPDYPGATARMNLDNALDFLLKTVPDFLEIVRGKEVLDFGCGQGFQAAALIKRGVCKRVVGLDLPRQFLFDHWKQFEGTPGLHLTTTIPAEKVDVVFSCSSFEHFEDPLARLEDMIRLTRPGGYVVITFAEPWFSPRGSHTSNWTRLPWVNLLFREDTVMRVRSRYRSDGATRYEDVEGGLNRMTINRFEELMRNSGLKIENLRLYSTKELPLVTRIPIVRELLTSAASCVLRKP